MRESLTIEREGEQMTMILNAEDECFDDPHRPGFNEDENTPCDGEISLWTSSSGETGAYRCERHGQAYDERSQAVYRDVQAKYPGFDVPGSAPPPWFDATFAGERWDEDY